jgi:beta-glucosidase
VEGKAGSLMCAYNAVNGVPACASDFLMQKTLRDAWKFTGVVVSDCGAIHDIAGGMPRFQSPGHMYRKTMAEAAAVSLQMGVDSNCADFAEPTLDTSDYDPYVEAQANGLVSKAVVDDSLRRLFTTRIKLGMFDPKGSGRYDSIPDTALNSPAHDALALRAANESMVLLKNNGLLPLKSTVKRIAVVGPLADQVPVLLGNYNGTPLKPVTALAGIRAAFPGAQITYAPGTSRLLRDPKLIPTSALTTPDGKPGLKAEIWASTDFKGTPAISRIDAQVNYTREMPKLLPQAQGKSARWTGFITAPETGLYNVGIEAGKSQFWIDGKLVAEDNQSTPRQPRLAEIRMEKGKRYQVRIEQNPSAGPVVRLLWFKVDPAALASAVASMKNADVVVAVVGISPQLEGEEMKVDLDGFLGGDRTSLDLPKEE